MMPALRDLWFLWTHRAQIIALLAHDLPFRVAAIEDALKVAGKMDAVATAGEHVDAWRAAAAEAAEGSPKREAFLTRLREAGAI